MPLEVNALVTWFIATFVFIAVVGVLYRRVTRRVRAKDEHKDEAPAY